MGSPRTFHPQDWPALWQIYPGRVWLHVGKRRPEMLVWCRCGACGTPAAVAWMGTCCGPCHDRREEGSEPPVHGPEQTVLAGHTDAAFGLAFSPDGRTLASGAMDCAIKLWDMTTGRERATLTDRAARVDTLAFSPDGKVAASVAEDETLRLWDAARGHTLGVFAWHLNRIFSVAFSPDGRWLATGGEDGTVRLWPWRALLEAGGAGR